MDESFDDVLDVLTNIDKSALDRAVEDEPLDQVYRLEETTI